MLTDERLKEIRDRVEAADPGPWCWTYIGEKTNGYVIGPGWGQDDQPLRGHANTDEYVEGVLENEFVPNRFGAEVGEHEAASCNYGNADFIAWAREDVTLLLAEIDRLRRDSGNRTSEGESE